MAFVQALFSVGMTTLVISILAGTALKIFQIATDIREAKELLKDIRRNTDAGLAPRQQPVPALSAPPSTAEELVRAVHAQKFGDDEFPV